MTLKRGRVLIPSKLSQGILHSEYAVRGEIAIESERLKRLLEAGNSNLPFKRILPCNVGNPQALNQPPISFYRKVVALMESFDALGGTSNAKKISDLFAPAVYERASFYRSQLKNSMGAYSHSQGHLFIRKLIASFIEKRDSFSTAPDETSVSCDPDHIFLTNGASSAIQSVLSLVISDRSVGVLIPKPQYPLYSASISLLHGVPVFYSLQEPAERFGRWTFSLEALKTSLTEARGRGVDVRALCIINPGNPTGNVLSCADLEDIIEFCLNERLVLLSDEVYQNNVWDSEVQFCSARKALLSASRKNPALLDAVEIFSFHSTSKGLLGECGKRGGYVACTNIDQEILSQFYKLMSISLCSAIDGQVMLGLMVDPLTPDADSEYEKHVQEITAIKGKWCFDNFRIACKKGTNAFRGA
ncbi:hypothetical protein DI09_4p380 [Mitosporidium daphniae]|uniref:Aminotransferase class I/classII large domain-containing protein n=1 Tax=Mitosporidium daphniae TaxID=1485682 RepID=A0A098VPS5_9MICR|nr:uncharacterized protein DI09_4p380 [Mitosporidium daphniae]KGG50955.1 hypothetical protein DI09_4p380 [Mitosporidium daphniae]|eukprot:XP_013237382.1 uncharacterized protein DI09_4p380 [Mitosporidium daphniae]